MDVHINLQALTFVVGVITGVVVTLFWIALDKATNN